MIKKLTTMIAICATITSSSLALTFHEGKDWGVDFDVDDTHCLALNIYYEARNDNLAGKVAVSDVVFNRMLDARYPNTICGVVQQAKLSQWHLDRGREVPVRNMCQFSWFCDGLPDTPRRGKSWDESQLIAQNFLTYGEYRGITEGATHYHATYVDPSWATSRGMHMIGRIGEHIFYRWK
jgi:spore germination cell wall hydrolase CwlJ-like protein